MAHQINKDNLPHYILLSLYILTGSLSNFGAIDILAPQWIYLGVINIITVSYFLYSKNTFLGKTLSNVLKSNFFIIYFFYLIWNILSYFYAINPTETLINIPRLGNTFFAIILSTLLLLNIQNSLYFIVRLFLLFLCAELIAYYNDLFTIFPTDGLRVSVIKGFAGNKNITAASIAFKVPFVLLLIKKVDKLSLKVLLSFVVFLAVLSISLIEARAAILSSLIVFILFLTFIIHSSINDKLEFSKNKKAFPFIILPYLLAIIINILITNSVKKGSITDTVGRIAFTEESSNGRFEYWTDALDYVLKNPIIASGLGNWKIASIEEGTEHISGYTVPYHAHNDFIHVFTETGIPGGLAYLSLFILLFFYIINLLWSEYKVHKKIDINIFFLFLPLIVYSLDAALNFPVARPLMQSSFALLVGLILSLYLNSRKQKSIKPISPLFQKVFLIITLLILIPLLIIHIISFKSLTQQGQLLYEFNNAQYNMTRAQLDEISHDFPNLTETAMPIKAMKARYYYLQGDKEEAHKMAMEGAKDNPKIYFGENLRSLFFFQEGNIDSAYIYAKKAFQGLPNNMPHYDMYLKTLVAKKDYNEIDLTFEKVRALGGDTKIIWTLYIRALAQTRSLGDPYAMEKAAQAYNLFPNDGTIFILYRVLTYGQQRLVQAEQLSSQATQFYEEKNYEESAKLFSEAFELDPLNHIYSLNAGISFYSNSNYEEAIKYLSLAQTSKKESEIEKAIRFKALSLYESGQSPQACAQFLKLVNNFPKRMYKQELNKYCRGIQ